MIATAIFVLFGGSGSLPENYRLIHTETNVLHNNEIVQYFVDPTNLSRKDITVIDPSENRREITVSAIEIPVAMKINDDGDESIVRQNWYVYSMEATPIRIEFCKDLQPKLYRGSNGRLYFDLVIGSVPGKNNDFDLMNNGLPYNDSSTNYSVFPSSWREVYEFVNRSLK